MKKFLFSIALMATALTAQAIDNNTVEVVYNGTTATVTVADNIANYVTVTSGTSSHVKLTQTNTNNVDGDEITYILSGTSTNGEFNMTGSFKCTVSLNNVTLTNPSGAAINIANGKRIKIKAETDTENTLTDGNGSQKGCLYVKGHLELRGNGTLNVTGNYAHAIKSGEYISIRNIKINVLGSVKDGMNCNEYFLMESGTVNITNAGDDGIQCDIENTAGTPIAATDNEHTDEDTGNFYQTGGTLNISLATSSEGKYIKVKGTENHTGGVYNGVNYDTGVESITISDYSGQDTIYDLNGRKLSATPTTGLYIIRNNRKATKVIIK